MSSISCGRACWRGELATIPRLSSGPRGVRLSGSPHVQGAVPAPGGCRALSRGRPSECIAQLEESIRPANGQSEARDWAFLAMAHARQGRVDEAIKWLERLAAFEACPICRNKVLGGSSCYRFARRGRDRDPARQRLPGQPLHALICDVRFPAYRKKSEDDSPPFAFNIKEPCIT